MLAMRAYELMIIFDGELEDAAIEQHMTEVNAGIATAGGEIKTTDSWGRRKFAYEIDHKTEGFYVVLEILAEGGALDELERSLRLADHVVRHKLIRLPDSEAARRGLLRSLQATGETIALLPVAISYERVPEEATFLTELRGAPAPPMRLGDLLRWSWNAWRGRIDIGRVHLACGRPVRLDLGDDVHATCRDLMAELRSRTVITSWHLRAFLESESASLEGIDLSWLRAAVERRGGRVLPSRFEHPAGPTLERSLRSQLEPFFCAEAAHLYAGNPAIERHLSRLHHLREQMLRPFNWAGYQLREK